MTSRTSTWFETKIRYEKMMEDGLQKRVTELYVVDAMSFTEAESMIIEEMSSYISGEMTIQTISRASYSEIFLSNVEADDKWYKAKLQFNDIDEKTEKEKHSYVNYLVNAGNIEAARKHIDEAMKTSMIPYVVKSISETSIMDVFKHKL
ncbi:MAG: DUF4494 domain-containing protein [Prevotella sp.]|nr:DUF4494 domain-containing protein [uncultured Prevotella sp.]MCH4241660.1 DUF4494 domain-containing protein [Prevotella sp.]